jgi:hypothetical protein
MFMNELADCQTVDRHKMNNEEEEYDEKEKHFNFDRQPP